MKNGFFALIARMRYIRRWGLMRNSIAENVQEHSHLTAVIAHTLAIVRNREFGGAVDAGECAVAALYHDAAEILTGDMPTPVKYHNAEITAAYKRVEDLASAKLLTLLPERLRRDFMPLLNGGSNEVQELVRAADKLSAYVKCVEERLAGNTEFRSAEIQTLDALESCGLPEVTYFLENFMPAFGATLDELTEE
ncbi:MAG: 5'-deoxynucleotidase [Oscillospiraceae bacterium]|jgi:5'-deoxynucleotidase|nr:5'-deoxynucleotidase [Oscillospiraceae bacterium]